MLADRRSLLGGLALLASTTAAMAQATKQDNTAAGPMLVSLTETKTAAQYYMGVIGPAERSLVTSQIAVEKASHQSAHEFAGFELGEAITVNMVLKDLGTTGMPMDATSLDMIEKMKAAAKGAAFDRAYIGFQLENHQNLRDLADAYLHNSAGSTDPAEKQGRHLAALMLAVFKEHVAICKRIAAELKA